MKTEKRLIIGISGSSGAILAIRLLQAIRNLRGLETYLVISKTAQQTIWIELGMELREVASLADKVFDNHDFTASIASGSFHTDGMIIAPCSIKSLSAVANSDTDTLMARAADVTLKEGRPLLLAVREAPLHKGHLRLMLQAAENGAIIFPPVPAFYNRPKTIEDIVDQMAGRMLERIGIQNELFTPWDGNS